MVSCMPKMYPLRGQYKVENTIETTSSYEDVWNKVINFFASNNIAISTIDKSSGIVAANDVVFWKTCLTMEDKRGVIENPQAWFVMPYEKNTKPVSVQCSLNVHVIDTNDGRVSITINIGNIRGKEITSNFTGLAIYPSYNFSSTGKFEKTLFRNSAKRIYPFEIKRVRRITSFSGNELATVPIAVVCIALLVQATLRMQRYKKYSG